MQFMRNSIFARSNTMFGVCQALGEDLGISPNWFRVALALGCVLDLKIAIFSYIGLGALVLISRIAYPGRGDAADEAEQAPVAHAAPAVVEVSKTETAMAKAA